MAPRELAGTVSPGKMSESYRKEHAPLGQPSAFSVTTTLYKSGHGSSLEASGVPSVSVGCHLAWPASACPLASSVLVPSDRNLCKVEKAVRIVKHPL